MLATHLNTHWQAPYILWVAHSINPVRNMPWVRIIILKTMEKYKVSDINGKRIKIKMNGEELTLWLVVTENIKFRS